MSADPSHAPHDELHSAAPAHDHEAEVAHAWKDLYRDIKFFIAFFALIIAAVIQFQFIGAQDNYWWIFALGAARFGLIGFFLFTLVRPFSLVVATLGFTILFFGGMVYLSMWGSYLPKVGNPIIIKHQP